MPILPLLATLVDFGGTLIVASVVLFSLRDYLRRPTAPTVVDDVRQRLASGLVFALSFKTGAGLIRTISIGTWRQFLGFFFILALRFFLGRVLKAKGRRRPDKPTYLPQSH